MSFKNFRLLLETDGKVLLDKEYENQAKEPYKFEFVCQKYLTILDLEAKTFSRENEEYEFFLAILTKSCTIHLKKEQLDFDILVDDCDLLQINNKIILEYNIETEDKKVKMSIEKIN